MKSKQLLALVVVLAAVAIAIYKFRQSDPAPITDSGARSRNGAPARTGAGSVGTTGTDAPPPAKKIREAGANEALVAEYGESRTNLSKQVAGNLVGLLEDAVAMGEMATKGGKGNPFGGGRRGLGGMGPVIGQLNLDEQQIEKATKLQEDFQKRQIAQTKASVERLKTNPAPLMKLMLAGDATASGKMTPEAYKDVQTSTASELQNIVNPMDRRNFGQGKPMEDPEFTAELRQILTPEQQATLQANLDAKPAPADDVNSGNITTIPPMELEKLDKAVTSGKTITSGLKQMMEGMGNLQDLGALPGLTEPAPTPPPAPVPAPAPGQ
jgi:Spy/CpxP family protein refolding chaperone